jgi:dCMP deaminase
MNWDEYFINIAEQVKLKSKDINTQIGVVVVGKDNEIVSTGYNSFPRGINDDIDERPERNAIYNAARIGVSTLGTTMYMTCGMSCSDCARAIINSGISKIVLRKGKGAKGDKWNDSSIRSIQMFKEAGVIVEYYD